VSPDANVGTRLRARREEIGLSLRKLAQSTGLTASFLSQVEHGKANLSLNSLQRLSEALQVPLLYFLADSNGSAEATARPAEPETPPPLEYSPITPHDQRLKLVLPVTGVEYGLLVPSLTRKMVALYGHLECGTENVARRLREPSEEFIYVLSGKLLVGLSSGEFVVGTGDTIYFDGEQLQRLQCASDDEDVTWISVITPAVF